MTKGATAIVLKGGDVYYTEVSVQGVISAIENKHELECFWFTTWGKLWRESFVFYDAEQVYLVRTESEVFVP